MQQLGFTRLGNPQGYPLAIIHGWGCDSSFLRPLAEMFPERDVYLIDLPGYGKSAHLAPIASDFIASTYLLINTIPYAADVIAWSFGTLYALHAISAINNSSLNLESYAHSINNDPLLSQIEIQQSQAPHSNDPQPSLLDCRLCSTPKNPYVRSLITICGSPRFPSDPNWAGMSAIKILKCNTVLTPHRVGLVLRLFYRMMVSSSTAKEEAYIQEVTSQPNQIPYEVLQAGIKIVTYLDERPTLQNLKVPSLHLFGAHDPLVPCSIASFFNQAPLHSSYVFPYSAHNPYLSEPERFKQVVSKFFEQVATMDYSLLKQR
ncbi:MAG TPA: alpha/beta fold hydrolase [Candidatus Anaerobiospirillum pullistercoris]|uniref:Alpha/beta fold hydrolase n=1 Tax=Candidatus Anaerobiospirillum pullistercoris TaxID=2838452 RepID=A0A9D1WCE5_9GAMM|nr:alpha/beta fold hydrolase [Candidatus Anaerobiospirillum pullistercoris]